MAFLDGWRFCPRCGNEASIAATTSPARPAAMSSRRTRRRPCRRSSSATAGCCSAGGRSSRARALGSSRRLSRGERAPAGRPRPRAPRGDRPRDRAAGIRRRLDGARYQGRTVLCLTWDARVTGGSERAADDVSELPGSRRTSCRRDDELAFGHFPRATRALARAARARVARAARSGTASASRARPARRRSRSAAAAAARRFRARCRLAPPT